MNELNNVLKNLNSLNKDELQQVSAKLFQLIQNATGVACVDSEAVDVCRKCGSKHIVKFGKDKNGKQRFKCKSCGATFTATSYSVVSNTHCSMTVWETYIGLLLDGHSLAECAQRCGISVRTAFIWRHKLLNALQKDQTNRILAGIVELDETFFAISYKGNHKNSKKFVMPREAYKRGNDNNAQTGSRACVMCALERNGQAYAEVLGKGQPTIPMLSHAFDARISDDSIVLTDKAVGARHYFERKESMQHIALAAVANPNKKTGSPEVIGAFHIQNVNNLHTRLRRFLRPYNGVSTKYLNHYVGLFLWLENHKKLNNHNIISDTKDYIKSTDLYISGSDLSQMPAIPTPAA